jgi:hypothetical protein
MVKAFEGIYLIRVNVDEWGWSIPEAHFPGMNKGILVFFELGSNGKPIGRWEPNPSQ